MDKAVIINDYPYHIQVIGQGKPTWLFLHGFVGSAADYEQVTPQGTRIYVDLLGFGPHMPIVTDPQRFTATQQSQDLIALLDLLALEQVNLVGYSMGARLALAMAIQYPTRVRQLFLESGTAGLADADDRAARQAADVMKAQEIESQGMAAFVAKWEQLPLFASQRELPATQQAFMHAQRVQQTATNVANSLRYFGTGAMPNYWPKLASLQVPTILITGMADTKFTLINEQMAAQIPIVTHEQVVGAGHNVHFEQPISVTKLLDRWARHASQAD